MTYFEVPYVLKDVLGTGVISALISGVPSGLFGIATYVLTALALYTLAQRRGLNRPWLAWIPVINCWILGSLSDQYRYVVKGEIRSKRKVLLTLQILMAVLGTAMVSVIAFMVVNLVGNTVFGAPISESRAMELVLGPLVGIAGLALPMAGISIAFAVVRFMALYDVYRSMDPSNSVLFLVLSILFGVTEPFFLFYNRNMDLGMPPRREEPIREPEAPVFEAPVREFWEADDTDNL